MLKLIAFLALTSLGSIKPGKAPAFEGHWEAYSKKTPGKVIGTLDIEKMKGKDYAVKYYFENDENQQGTADACWSISFAMVGTFDGEWALVTDLMGFRFDWNWLAETPQIDVTADGNDPFFRAPNCVGGSFIKTK
jgi:hypothetical protein